MSDVLKIGLGIFSGICLVGVLYLILGGLKMLIQCILKWLDDKWLESLPPEDRARERAARACEQLSKHYHMPTRDS